MPLPSPNLDDRDFAQLLAEAVERVRRADSAWSSQRPGDPGMVLLEAFAYLTDLMLYRLNRIPEKVHVELLRMLGVTLEPPTAAQVTLQLSRRSGDEAVTVPAGTTVRSSSRQPGDEVVFALDEDVRLHAGDSQATGQAHHCDQVHAELLGTATGRPGERFQLARPPVVRRTGHELDLAIGVEATPDELQGRPRAREHDGIAYLVWDEVESFADVAPSDRVYTVDRVAGTVTFAPSVRRPDGSGTLAADPSPVARLPRPQARVMAWYRRGGGAAGNVAPGVLTSIDAPGVEVTNAERAVGGRDTERLENAIQRGAQELHEPRRAVTADDVERIAVRVGGVSRARASTAADVWAHADAGTVEVVLVPAAPEPDGALNLAELDQLQASSVLSEVAASLERRQPLGIRFATGWADVKPVVVEMRIVVDATEDPAAVQRRVTERLREAISPVPRRGRGGWPFGRSLRASDVFDIALREPGVRYVDQVRFELEEVPDADVTALAADRRQPDMWYAGSRSTIFRSLDDGRGWDPVARFPDGARVDRIVPHPGRAGLVAAVVHAEDADRGAGTSQLWISRDGGSTWDDDVEAAFSWEAAESRHRIQDVAWLGNEPELLLATDLGLYSHALGDATPLRRIVVPGEPERRLYAVATSPLPTRDGHLQVIVAMGDRGGLYRSITGPGGSFEAFGLTGEDVRDLHIDRRGNRMFLWAATYAVGDDPGRGCFRTELREEADAGRAWRHYGAGWDGGICHDVAVSGDTVIAGSRFNGVLVLDLAAQEPAWRAPSVETSNLPLEESRRFQPILAVDVGSASRSVLVAGGFGVFRTADLRTYQDTARRTLDGEVTLPPAGVFASGEHRVEVSTDDASR